MNNNAGVNISVNVVNTRGDSLLVTNIPNYNIYRPDADNEYDKKKYEEHRKIYAEISRVNSADEI